MTINTIAIGCDHAGFPYKAAVIKMLSEKGISVIDKGTYSLDSVDYPDFVHPVAEALEQNHAELGILMCGSGNGVSMTANKHQSIRAALCWNKEIAELARLHNNANIISIPVRFVSEEIALEMISTFISTEFEGGRHGRRVDKMAC
ncbi:MAG: ribose 5-phosphate isomerase B [Saprospiraceae bacterium]